MIAEWALEHFKYDKTQRMLISVCAEILHVLNSEVLVTASFNLALVANSLAFAGAGLFASCGQRH